MQILYQRKQLTRLSTILFVHSHKVFPAYFYIRHLIELLVAQSMKTLFLQIILSEYDIDTDACRLITNINKAKILIMSKILYFV